MSLRDFLFHEEPGITLYCGDNRVILPMLWYDAVIADQPYGNGKKYEEQQASAAKFAASMAMLSALEVPTAVTVPCTKIYDIPRPQWLGVWHKPMCFGFWNTPFYPHWEAIAFYHLGAGTRASQDVWSFNPEQPNGHPTPKPPQLWQALMLVLAGTVTVDPFAGSGTILEAAKNLNRSAIGIELEPRYCEIAVRRLRQEVLPLYETVSALRS